MFGSNGSRSSGNLFGFGIEPAVQVTAETGFKVKASNRNNALKDIAKAMNHLVKNPQMRIHMGEAGGKLVRQTYSWQARGERLSQLYKQIVN